MPKWLLAILHVGIAAGSVATALNLGNTKTGGAIVAAGAALNALLPTPVPNAPKFDPETNTVQK